jgi:hypothetical protein
MTRNAAKVALRSWAVSCAAGGRQAGPALLQGSPYVKQFHHPILSVVVFTTCLAQQGDVYAGAAHVPCADRGRAHIPMHGRRGGCRNEGAFEGVAVGVGVRSALAATTCSTHNCTTPHHGPAR